MIKAIVHNYRGVATPVHASIDRVTIVCGPNASGKSSVCGAVSALLTGMVIPRGMTKRDAGVLVGPGQAIAAMSLEWEKGSATATLPACDFRTTGTPPRASVIAAGLARLNELGGPERAKLVAEVLDTAPTKADLREALPGMDDARLDGIWARVERDGWDLAHGAAKERGATLKGQWREVTGEQYGSQKAEKWRPEALVETDLSIGADTLKEMRKNAGDVAVAAERAARRERLQKQIVEAHDKRPAAAAAVAQAEEDLARARMRLESLPAFTGDSGMPCPHCGKTVRVVSDGGAAYHFEPTQVAGDRKEHEARQRDAEAARDAVRAAQSALDQRQQEVSRLDGSIKAMSEMVQEAAPEGTGGDHISIDRIDAALAFLRARTIADTIASNTAIVAALAPDGARAIKIQSAIEAINVRMMSVCRAMGISDRLPVRLNADLSVGAARPYDVLSESERWLVNAVTQIAFGEEAHDDIVVIDGADVLDANGRNAFFNGLADVSIPALVGMTIGAKANVPDVSPLDGWSTVWVGKA